MNSPSSQYLTNESSAYHPEIDGLRAIAVLMVIANHFDNVALPSGYLGVDVFFVISGYVITASLVKRPSASFSELMQGFYARRLKRLMPALVLCVFVTSMLFCIVNPDPGVSLITGIASIFGLSNLYLLQQATNYFGIQAELNAFTQTWSLGVEEQFYLLFPLLIWITSKWKGARSGPLLYTIATLAAASLCVYIYVNRISESVAYFLMPTRFWELGIGCSLYFIVPSSGPSTTSGFASLALLGALVVTPFIAAASPVLPTIVTVTLTALLIGTLRSGTAAYRILTWRPVLHVGLISYSLYLWHWSVIALSRFTVGLDYETALFQIPLMFLLAEISYRYVETPLRHARWSPTRLETIGIALSVSVTVAVMIGGIGKFAHKNMFAGEVRVGGIAVASVLKCQHGTPEQCLLRTRSSKEIFMIGDSHLSSLVPSVTAAAAPEDIAVAYFGGADFVRSIFGQDPCADGECYRDDVRRIMHVLSQTVHKGDAIVFSMDRSRIYLPDHYSFLDVSRAGAQNPTKMHYLQSALEMLADFAEQRGALFIVVDDVPSLCSAEEAARSAFNQRSCRPIRKVSLEDRRPLTELYRSLIKMRPSTRYIDPHDSLCPDAVCEVTLNGKPLYADTSPHLTMDNRLALKSLFAGTLIPMMLTRR